MGKTLEQVLSKFNLSKDELKELLKHLTSYKEIIKLHKIRRIGDPLCIDISIVYVFDNEPYNVSFIISNDSNDTNWTWEMEEDLELDDDDIHFKFLSSICDKLQNTIFIE